MRLSLLHNLYEETATPTLTFGLEIEIFFGKEGEVSHATGTNMRYSHDLMKHFKSLPLKLDWDVDLDGTCLPGIEIKSPIMPAASISERRHSLTQISADLNLIGSVFTINNLNPRECGTHIHIGGAPPETQQKFGELWVANLQQYLRLFIRPERYQEMEKGGTFQSVGNISDFFFRDAAQRIIGSQKYLNVRFHETYKTIEFRAMEATIDPARISYMVNLALNVVEKADTLYDLLQKKLLSGRTLAKEVLPKKKKRQAITY